MLKQFLTMENLFSPKTLATYLGVAEQTIYNRHSTGGDLPQAIKIGRLLRFRLSDVTEWLEAKTALKAKSISLPPPASVSKRHGRPTKAEKVASRR